MVDGFYTDNAHKLLEKICHDPIMIAIKTIAKTIRRIL